MKNIKSNLQLKNHNSSTPILNGGSENELQLESSIQSVKTDVKKNFNIIKSIQEYLENNISLPQIEKWLKKIKDDVTILLGLSHTRLHALDSALDHSSTIDEGYLMKGDANGLPSQATNTDAEVAAAVSASHAAATVVDSTSIDMSITGQEISASAKFGTTSGTVCEGNDARLSDARTPTTHTHSKLVASDGSPDPALSMDASGNALFGGRIGISTSSPKTAIQIADINQYCIYLSKSSGVPTTWYLLGIVPNNNGALNIRGLLGGNTAAEGRSHIDITINGRDGLTVIGNVWGKIGTSSDIVIYYDSANSQHLVYLKTDDWALVNLDLSTVTAAYVAYTGTDITTDPVGSYPLVYTLSTSIGAILHLDNLGNFGIGTVTQLAKLAVNGGVHVGGDSDPGDNNLLVDGTATVIDRLILMGNTAKSAIRGGTGSGGGVILSTFNGETETTRLGVQNDGNINIGDNSYEKTFIIFAPTDNECAVGIKGQTSCKFTNGGIVVPSTVQANAVQADNLADTLPTGCTQIVASDSNGQLTNSGPLIYNINKIFADDESVLLYNISSGIVLAGVIDIAYQINYDTEAANIATLNISTNCTVASVALLHEAGNLGLTAVSDTDNKFCVYVSGGKLYLKNRLGTSISVMGQARLFPLSDGST